MRGTPRAYTDLSISATPTDVRTPAFSVPRRILRTTSGSSPATPPGKGRPVPRPPEAAFHFSPSSLRIRYHDDPSGTRVAVRTISGAWARAAGANEARNNAIRSAGLNEVGGTRAGPGLTARSKEVMK